MAGLLDILNTDQGRMGLGLLAAAGPRTDGAGFGQRLQEGMGQFDAYKANALKQKMLQAQMQEYEQAAQDKAQARQQAQVLRDLATKFATPAQGAIESTPDRAVGNSLGNPSLFSQSPSNAVMPGVPGREAKPAGFDREGFGQAWEAIDPVAGGAYLSSIQKDNKPISLAEGASLVRPDGTTIFHGHSKAEQKDPKVKQYEYAKAGGYKGSFEQFVTLGPTIMAAAAAPLRDAQVQNIQDENAYNLPAPRKAVSGQVSVTTPDGRSYSFPNQAAASNFKLKAGIR